MKKFLMLSILFISLGWCTNKQQQVELKNFGASIIFCNNDIQMAKNNIWWTYQELNEALISLEYCRYKEIFKQEESDYSDETDYSDYGPRGYNY